MEKKILYICVILLSAYLIYLNLISTPTKNQNFYAELLEESVEIEAGNRGKILLNAKIFDKENKENQLHDILSQSSMEYSLVIVTSLYTCSLCREQLLKMWNELYKTEKSLPIHLIIAEEDKISKAGRRGVKASMIGLKIEMPYYIETEPVLLNELGITASQTPLSIIVSREKKIIAVDRATQTYPESSLNFQNFFMLLN